MSKSKFKNTSIAWLLGFVLVAIASFQSLHELVDHSEIEHCEICFAFQDNDLDSAIPVAVQLPAMVADGAPEIIAAFFAPSLVENPPSARGPPSSASSFQTASAE